MDTFILKIYRQDKTGNKLVGTLQNINSEQQFSFTTKVELCDLLESMVNADGLDDDMDDASSNSTA